jgi:predicted ATPase/class 3 adenylate cyclase
VSSPPSGTVTFLFTDIEGSTQRWERDRAAMQDNVRRHDAILRAAIASNNGHVFKTIGDAFCAAFALAPDAIAAALEAQQKLASQDFGELGLRVRMSLHTGNADERDGDYFGPALNRVARLLAVGYGGQVLVSGVTSELVQGQMPSQATLRDLGAHRLKDLARPEQIYQLVAPDLCDAFAPLRTLNAIPNNLPLQLTSFVGRDEEIAEITSLLAKHRLLTLIGSGGVGKTRISLQVAANLLESHPDGTWLVEFAPLADSRHVPATIESAAHLSIDAGGDPYENLVAQLRDKHSLLIFDNCEHLVAAVAAPAAAIARGCPNVTILASSRQGLGVAGEATYRMPSLSVPGVGESEELTAQSARAFGAIALFVARAEAADVRFTLTNEDAPVVADICRRLDGIALAIELAAARVNILKPKELRSRLDQRFRVLTGGGRDRLPRQQTLRALIDWSFDLLDERERALFRRTGIFVDGFAIDGAVAVGADETLDEFEVFDVLASLVDKSLVVAELAGEATRYRLLESARAYAVEKLDEAGERDSVAERYFAYMHGLFASARAAYESSPRESTLLALIPELDDLRSALEWAVTRDPARGADLLCVATLFVDLDLGAEAMARAETFLEIVPPEDAAILARLWTLYGYAAASRYDSRRGLNAGQRSLSYARIAGDEGVLIDALVRCSNAAIHVGDTELATGLLSELTPLRLNPRQRLSFLSADAKVAASLGQGERAARAWDEFLASQRAFGNFRGQSVALINAAEVAHEFGDTQKAIRLARDAVKIAERAHDDSALHIKMNIVAYLLAVDDCTEALALGADVLRALAKRDAGSATVCSLIEHLALAHALDADYTRAATLVGFTEHVMELLGIEREYTEIVSHDRVCALLRAHLPDEERTALQTAGAALTPADAIALTAP